jgi:hypothetical protein
MIRYQHKPCRLCEKNKLNNISVLAQYLDETAECVSGKPSEDDSIEVYGYYARGAGETGCIQLIRDIIAGLIVAATLQSSRHLGVQERFASARGV